GLRYRRSSAPFLPHSDAWLKLVCRYHDTRRHGVGKAIWGRSDSRRAREEGGLLMPPGGDDLPFRLAATLAIDLMTAKHGLDEGVAIDVAWSSYKELESVGPNARFQI